MWECPFDCDSSTNSKQNRYEYASVPRLGRANKPLATSRPGSNLSAGSPSASNKAVSSRASKHGRSH